MDPSPDLSLQSANGLYAKEKASNAFTAIPVVEIREDQGEKIKAISRKLNIQTQTDVFTLIVAKNGKEEKYVVNYPNTGEGIIVINHTPTGIEMIIVGGKVEEENFNIISIEVNALPSVRTALVSEPYNQYQSLRFVMENAQVTKIEESVNVGYAYIPFGESVTLIPKSEKKEYAQMDTKGFRAGGSGEPVAYGFNSQEYLQAKSRFARVCPFEDLQDVGVFLRRYRDEDTPFLQVPVIKKWEEQQ